MIVKILWKSKTFSAVRYNTNKVEKNKGELVKISGFGALQSLSELRPEDYVNYLSAMSKRNSRTIYPQFHAMISAKGKSMGKAELTALAEGWLKGMGYGDQPYILIFHRDTDNNHIHMVSSRIDRNGRKISDRYENIRAYKVLNKLIGRDEKLLAERALAKALEYNFSTRARFMMLLEKQGYLLRIAGEVYEISKFGEKQVSVELSKVDNKILGNLRDEKRNQQLKQIFSKYRLSTDASLYAIREQIPGGGAGKITAYSSALSEKLSADFGLECVFHFKNEKPPYGYTILDHARKQVFKGREIMAMAEFIQLAAEKEPTAAVLVDIESDENQGKSSFAPDEKMLLSEIPEVLVNGTGTEGADSFYFGALIPDIDISDDIDDEQILGRNRRRQKKARTNTR